MPVNVGTLEVLLKVRDELSPAIKKVESGFGGSFLKMASVAGVAATAVKLVTDGLKAQAAQEAAINKLNLALANQGRLTAATSKALIEQASALQAVSTVGDEVITNSQAILASYGMNEAQIKRTTAATLDFAAATGKDLAQAADLLGKAFVGETGALSRYGIIVDEGLSKTKKFDAAIGQLEARFRGQATAATANFSGQLKQLGNDVGDASESLGKFWAEAFGDSMGAAFGGLRDFAKLAQFFFGDLLIRMVGEARARVLEMAASIVELNTKISGLLAKLPGGMGKFFSEDAAASKDLAEALRFQAAEARRVGDEAAAGAGKLLTFANAMSTAAAAAKSFSTFQFNPNNFALPDTGRFRRSPFENILQDIGSHPRGLQIGASLLGPLPALSKEIGATLKSALAGAFKDLPRVIMGAIQGGGDVGAAIGASLGQGVGKHFGEKLGAHIGGNAGKMFGPVGEVLGTVLGQFAGKAFGSVFGKLFSGEGKKVNRLRDEFVAAAGGIDELARRAQAAGLTLDRLLNAKKVKDYEAAIRELQDAFDLQAEAQEKLQEAIQKYGFTIEELGPKFKQLEMDKLFGALLQDFELLRASGIEVDTILTRMAPSLNEMVQQAIKAGVAIPENFRPILQRMAEMGLLVDENGNALEDLGGINFTESLSAQFQKLIDKINELIDAIAGVPRNIDVNTNYTSTGTPPGNNNNNNDDGGGGEKQAPSALGFHGFVTSPTRFLAGEAGTERVDITPASDMGAGDGALLSEVRALRRDLDRMPFMLRDALIKARGL